MNVSAMNAPASTIFSSKKPQTSEDDSKRPAIAADPVADETEPTTDSISDPWAADSSAKKPADENKEGDEAEAKPPPPAAPALPSPESEEDEEIRLAMEMAIAAAQNPHLSPVELQKLVAEKNKQVAIVDEIKHKQELEKQKEQEKEQEEAQKRWGDKKEKAMNWWHERTERVTESVLELRESAGQAAEELQDRVERRRYADKIKQDPAHQDIRKKMKVTEKTLKAHRLQGNRVETRHAFKRQRQEKKLLELNKKLDKTHKLFVDSSYNVHEYAKAMMRASRKWKKQGTDEELSLEAQLCRNMHQMLAIEKQKSKVKKTSREIKKYMQRCKGWLSDKKALHEMHLMTLDATNSSYLALYEDTLAQQDALIAKLMDSEEFKGVDLESVELDNWKQLNEKTPGPSATLSALRGLPINDSIRIKKEQLGRADDRKPPPAEHDNRKAPPPDADDPHQTNPNRPELYIETHDEGSAHSDISDPDGDSDHMPEDVDGSLNSSGSLDFGNDAPWTKSECSTDLDSVEEEEPPAAPKPRAVVGKDETSNKENDKAAPVASAAQMNGEHKLSPAEASKTVESEKSAHTATSGLEYSEADSSLVGNEISGSDACGAGYVSDVSPTEKQEEGETNPASVSVGEEENKEGKQEA